MTTLTDTTPEILLAMLTENTGRHMLDSGGAYGRHWEDNQGLTLETLLNSPRVTVGKYGDVSLSIFHHLKECATYSAPLDAAFQEFSQNSENSYLQDMAEFIQYIGAENQGSFNSYNWKSNLSQVIQFHCFNIGEENYALIQIHGGADVRGGYTRPRVFSVLFEELASENLSLICNHDPDHILWTSGGAEWTDSKSGNWEHTPYSLWEKASERGVEGIACAVEDCLGILDRGC